MGFSNDYTVGVWVGRADGAPRPDRLGRNDAAPVLLKMFDLLPPDKRAPAPAPRDAILAGNADALPVALRQFTREADGAAARQVVRPPAIAFPPDGAVVSVAARETPRRAADENSSLEAVALKVSGGRAPFTWVVNGAPLGSFDRYTQTDFTPDGEGFTRITVIDADGNSATSKVKFKKQK